MGEKKKTNLSIVVLPIDEEVEEKKDLKFRWFGSMRMVVVFMCSFGIIVMGIERFNINFGVLCMVNYTDPSTNTTNPPADYGTLRWSNAQIGLIFSAVYWGNIFTVLPAGWLAKKFGGVPVWFVGVVCSIVGSLLTPVAAIYSNIAAVFAVRFFIGLGQGIRQPCMSTIVANWVPVDEMSFSLGIITAGMQLASILSNIMGGGLCTSDFMGGWESIYYVSAFLGVIWCIVWPVLVTDSPNKNRWISKKENRFISHHLKAMKKQPEKVPWMAIATSPAVWAMNYANFAGTLGNYTISMYIPTYFSQVLHIPIAQDGITSALPLITQYIGILLICLIADSMKKYTKLNHSFIAIFFNSIACFGEGILLILVGYLRLNSSNAVIGMICLGSGLSGGFTPGWWTSIQTVAPLYSGILQSISSFFSIIGSIITPYIVSGLTPQNTVDEWEIVFIIVGAALISAGLLYAIFGRATPQKWAYGNETETIEEKTRF